MYLKNGKRKGKITKMKKSPEERHTHSHGKLFDIFLWSVSGIFLNQKIVNVSEHVVKMASCESFWKVTPVGLRDSGPLVALFKDSHVMPYLACVHMHFTFTLFWLRKISVIVKIYQISFHVFVYAFPPEISSFFGKSFPFLFLLFVLTVIWYFPFHVDCMYLYMYKCVAWH